LRTVCFVIFWLGLAVSALAQGLSTVVIPSEDELYEALILGEIDYEQYVLLKEILLIGIDSSNIHLLDEIPNLSWFGPGPPGRVDSLSTEQETPFCTKGSFGKGFRVQVDNRYYRELEASGRYRNNLAVLLSPNSHLRASCKLQRDLGGQERIVSRQVRFHSEDGLVRELTLGSDARRLGLGTVFGYRGKLFEFSHELDEESFLFPDYGGSNGLYTRLVRGDWETQVVTSVQATPPSLWFRRVG
jgi:hypothetical protein